MGPRGSPQDTNLVCEYHSRQDHVDFWTPRTSYDLALISDDSPWGPGLGASGTDLLLEEAWPQERGGSWLEDSQWEDFGALEKSKNRM